MSRIPLLPIPVEGEAAPLLGVLLALGGVAVFVVLLWQTVRVFRADRRPDATDRADDPAAGDRDDDPPVR